MTIGIYCPESFEQMTQNDTFYALVAEGKMRGKQVILLNDSSFMRGIKVNGLIRKNGKWLLRKNEIPEKILNYGQGNGMIKGAVYPANKTSLQLLNLLQSSQTMGNTVLGGKQLNIQEIIMSLDSHIVMLKTQNPHEEEVVSIVKQEDTYRIVGVEGEELVDLNELQQFLETVKEQGYFAQSIQSESLPLIFHISLIKEEQQWEIIETYVSLLNEEIKNDMSTVLELLNPEKANFLQYYVEQFTVDLRKELETLLEMQLVELKCSFILDANQKFWVTDVKLSSYHHMEPFEYARMLLSKI